MAYGRVLANGFKYVEDQILEKQDLDADYDLLTGASFSMKNMIGLKDDVSAQRKDSNQRSSGTTATPRITATVSPAGSRWWWRTARSSGASTMRSRRPHKVLFTTT
ncbi:MAG: hypothetical protein ACLTYN_05280 [Dysosmobacter welbionis]